MVLDFKKLQTTAFNAIQHKQDDFAPDFFHADFDASHNICRV